MTHIFLYKDRIYDFVLIRENTDQRKLIFWHILREILKIAYFALGNGTSNTCTF